MERKRNKTRPGKLGHNLRKQHPQGKKSLFLAEMTSTPTPSSTQSHQPTQSTLLSKHAQHGPPLPSPLDASHDLLDDQERDPGAEESKPNPARAHQSTDVSCQDMGMKKNDDARSAGDEEGVVMYPSWCSSAPPLVWD